MLQTAYLARLAPAVLAAGRFEWSMGLRRPALASGGRAEITLLGTEWHAPVSPQGPRIAEQACVSGQRTSALQAVPAARSCADAA